MKTTSDFDNRDSAQIFDWLEARVEAFQRRIIELLKPIPLDEAMLCPKCGINRMVKVCAGCGGDLSLLSAHLEAVRLQRVSLDGFVVKVERE